MNWKPAGYPWNEVPGRFARAKRDDEAAGGDGLDTTIVFSLAAPLEKVLRVAPLPVRLLLDPFIMDLAPMSNAIVAVHWGGEADDLAAALYAWAPGLEVRYAEDGEDHHLQGGHACQIAAWIGEDLQHKVGWALGFWPRRERY